MNEKRTKDIFPSTNEFLLMSHPHTSCALHRRRCFHPVSLRLIAGLLLALLIPLTAALADSTFVDAGQISGLWTRLGSPYVVRGNLEIYSGDTLRINADVTVYFNGSFNITVHGVLLALGAEDDNIIFTTDTTANPDGWQGLRVIGSGAVSRLECTILENGRCLGQNDYGLGGALFCDRASVELTKTQIQYCRALSGGGIYARNSSVLMLQHTQVHNNDANDGCGGGISCRTGTALTLMDCDIKDNVALYGAGMCLDGTVAEIAASRISKNAAEIWGGGIFSSAARITMYNSVVTANSSIGGGGIDGRWEVTLTMDRCVISNNTAVRPGIDGSGGGMALIGGEQVVTNCTIVGNLGAQGSAIYGANHLHLTNSIIVGNLRSRAVYFTGIGAEINYNCFNNNAGGNFAGSYVPYYLGEVVQVNANEDSCDVFANVFDDPLFVDSAEADYTLQSDSPCIDAGDPQSPHDPDNSIADIGAYWYNSPDEAAPAASELPRRIALHPAFPNPFNPAATLAFDLPQSARISLRIFDIMGREIAVLADGKLSAGHYEINWNAAGFASGTYFAVLESSGIHSVQKLLLLK
jgi:hypothetical protein